LCYSPRSLPANSSCTVLLGMRILYLNGHPIWLYGLPWGFRHLGHQVKIAKNVQSNLLLPLMKSFKPDLLITVGWVYEYMKPQKRALIKKIAHDFGCLHAYWATEDITWFEKWSLPMVRAVQPDVVFTINADCIPFYRNLGIPAFHLEFAYNPSYEGDVSSSDDVSQYTADLALVANSYNIWQRPDRFRYKSVEILVRPLIEKNYHLLIGGKGWEAAPWAKKESSNVHYLGSIPFRDTFRVYQSAKIILNLQNQDEHTTQITSRTFEIMGCGGFQLTARTPAVERLFTHQQHLVMSGSPEETLELADYYLAHEQERQEIAANGREEVLKKHTYDQRAAYLLSCLKSLKLKKK
jgi:spore maturation protein CgeB